MVFIPAIVLLKKYSLGVKQQPLTHPPQQNICILIIYIIIYLVPM